MKIISKETSKRVCDHMNKDHMDSVHKYLIHYGNISSFENAYMEEINNSCLLYTSPSPRDRQKSRMPSSA